MRTRPRFYVPSMLVDASRAWLLAALLVPSIAGASVAHIPSTIEGIFKAVPYSKLVRISALTVRDLKYASKAEEHRWSSGTRCH